MGYNLWRRFIRTELLTVNRPSDPDDVISESEITKQEKKSPGYLTRLFGI